MQDDNKSLTKSFFDDLIESMQEFGRMMALSFISTLKFVFTFKCCFFNSLIATILLFLSHNFIGAFWGILLSIGFGSCAVFFPKAEDKIGFKLQSILNRFNIFSKSKDKPSEDLSLTLEKSKYGHFISDIYQDIEKAIAAKYPGYEIDVVELRNLALQLIEAKKEKSAISEMDAVDSEWVKELVKIEGRMAARLKEQQSAKNDQEALDQIDQMIAAENVALPAESLPSPEENGPYLKLTLHKKK